MPVVGLAEVLVTPVFTGVQNKISRSINQSAGAAGRSAGTRMGAGLADGFATETKSLQTEVDRLTKTVTKSQDQVAAGKSKLTAASAAENKALGDLRVAELRLQEARDNGNAKASAVAAAEERVASIRDRVSASTARREGAERTLAKSVADLESVQKRSASASDNLARNLRATADESVNTERNVSRLGQVLSRVSGMNPFSSLSASVRKDSDKIGSDLTRMKAIANGFALATTGLTLVAPAAGAAGAALLGASGNVLTLASSLGSLAGVTALAPAALISVGSGAGVMALALNGVGDALKAVNDQQSAFVANPRIAAMAVEDAAAAITVAEQNAARAQVDAARRVTDAKRSLQDAIRAAADAEKSAADATESAARQVRDAKFSLQTTIESVAEAQEAAARSVEQAERQEAAATRAVTDAQNGLLKAREQAATRVEDVSRRLTAANLKATDSALAYQRASDAYNKAKADPGTGASQLAQLSNNMAKALNNNERAKQSVVDLRKEQATAQAEAKKGGAAVLAAEQKVADARQAQADAVQAREEAQQRVVRQQRDGAMQIVRAQEAVTEALKAQKDAQEQVARTGEQSARQVADAQQAVADASRAAGQAQTDSARSVEQAYRNLERLQLQQSDAAEKAGLKSALAMDKLTPSAQEAVRTLLMLRDTLDVVRRTAQENFFTGISAGLVGLTTKLLPQLTTGVGAVATAFNGTAKAVMTSLGSALGGGALNTLLQGVATSITIVNRAIDPLISAFVTLGVVGMQYMPRLAQAIVDVSTRFDAFIQRTAANGQLVGWIDAGIVGFENLGSIVGSVVGIFGDLTRAAAAGGATSTLASLASGLRDLDTAMSGPTFQTTMTTIFAGAQQGADGLLRSLGPIGAAFDRGAVALAEFLRLGGEIAGVFVGGVFTALSAPSFGAGLTTFMEALQRGVQAVAPLMPGLTSAFGDILTSLGPIVERLGPSLVTVFSGIAVAVSNVLGFLRPALELIAGSPVLIGLMIGAGLILSATMLAWTAATTAWTAATKVAVGAQWLLNAAWKANPIGLVITAVGLLVGALVWFFTQTEWGRNVVVASWVAIQIAIGAVVTWWNTVAWPLLKIGIDAVGAGFTWLYQNVIQPVFQGIAAVVTWWWQNIVNPIFTAVVWYVRNVLAPVYMWLWNNVVAPAFRGIGAVISWAWTSIIQPAFSALVSFVRTVIAPAVVWLWNNVVAPAFRGIGSWISSTWAGTIQPAFAALVSFMRTVMAPAIWWFWRNIVEPYFGGIGRTISWVWANVIKKAFEFISTAIRVTLPNAFRTGVDSVKKWWDGLKEIAKAPIRFVVNTVINDGLIGAFNTVAGFLPGVKTLDPVILPDGFATGGVAGILPGRSMWRQGDDQIIRARRGEGILMSEVVSDPYERARLLHMNAEAKKGKSAEAARASFAGGAFAAGPPGGPAGGIWSALQQAASAAGRMYFPKRSFLGVDTEKAAKAWVGQSALDVRIGDGNPGIQSYLSGGPGGWGYYSGNSIWMQPGGPKSAAEKIGVLVHEMGHALSLAHTDVSDTSSVMNPMQKGGNWPQPGDYATLRRIWGNPGDGVKRYSAADVGIDAGGMFNPIGDLIAAMSSKFREAFPAGGMLADLAIGTGTKLITGVRDWVGGKLGSVVEGATQVVSGAVDRAKVTAWMTEALIKKGEFNPGNLIAGVNRAFKESGGNPNAVNGWDVNAKNGDPSRGLMQVIGATFRQFMEPGYGNVLNPVDNILASINYTRARYGSLSAGWNLPGGYARGGIVGNQSAQPSWIMAASPYLYDQGGIVPPGLSQVVNLTRQPEHIYTRAQSEALQTLAARGAERPSVYVQNPFTGEYLLARVDDRVGAGMSEQARDLRVRRVGR